MFCSCIKEKLRVLALQGTWDVPVEPDEILISDEMKFDHRSGFLL